MEREASPVLVEELILFPIQSSDVVEETDEMCGACGCGTFCASC